MPRWRGAPPSHSVRSGLSSGGSTCASVWTTEPPRWSGPGIWACWTRWCAPPCSGFTRIPVSRGLDVQDGGASRQRTVKTVPHRAKALPAAEASGCGQGFRSQGISRRCGDDAWRSGLPHRAGSGVWLPRRSNRCPLLWRRAAAGSSARRGHRGCQACQNSRGHRGCPACQDSRDLRGLRASPVQRIPPRSWSGRCVRCLPCSRTRPAGRSLARGITYSP
jgi:hypothetical protein